MKAPRPCSQNPKPRQNHIVWGFMGRLMASMKTRHPLKDTHWVGVMTVPQWFGENSKQCGSVRERDGWGLWIKLKEDDTWRVLVVAGGGLQPNSCVMGKRKRKQSVNILFDIWMGAGKLEGTSYKLKTRLRFIVKWFKTTETWWGLRVGLLFSSKQSLNVWCPVHRDYETINKTSQWGDVCFYI